MVGFVTTGLVVVGVIVVLFALVALTLIRSLRRAGPLTVSELDLRSATSMLLVTREAPGEGWVALGSETRARGLDLYFGHPDDPQAEATLRVPGADPGASRVGRGMAVRLGADFETFHVHNAGYVFRVRMRGTGPTVGRRTRIKMFMAGKKPYGGRIENDGDIDAAVGWIEIGEAEILAMRGMIRGWG